MKTMRFLLPAAVLCAAGAARAETYVVGPGESYEEVADLPALGPGDVVEITGGHTYAAFELWDDGAPGDPITIRGVAVGGERPVIAGGVNTVAVNASHYVVEGLDITGGTSRCFYHHGDDVTLRDSAVHDCPAHGILGADNDSGSFTLEHVEVYGCGDGDSRHQIYMATDEVAHPGAVFRMRFCWVHDGNGGNGVKSRAERNEIHYNWIEGSYYHELELIGPDPEGAQDGWSEDLAREDSDVVGNVLVKAGANAAFPVLRFGGDATGQSWGRYRFVNNTVLVADAGSAVFRLFDGLESVEAHNNVFYNWAGGGVRVMTDGDADWADGDAMAGSFNWLPDAASDVPYAWTDTLGGADPGLADVDPEGGLLPLPIAGSVLVDAGTADTAIADGHEFPEPLLAPAWVPPIQSVDAPGEEAARPDDGAIDLGAYELGSGDVDSDADGDADADGDGGSGDGDADGDLDGDGDADVDDGVPPTSADRGCGCRAAGGGRLAGLVAAIL